MSTHLHGFVGRCDRGLMRESVGGYGMTRNRSAGPYRSSCRRRLIVISILYLIFAWRVVWWNKVDWTHFRPSSVSSRNLTIGAKPPSAAWCSPVILAWSVLEHAGR
jgi:hypothetical protein